MFHYYLNPYGGNFGDALGADIVEVLAGFKVRSWDLGKLPRKARPGVMALGSIFHHAQDNDVIWGTGINPTWMEGKRWERLDIRAVRGPATYDFVTERLGLPCPRVYGDPAVLTPLLFPGFRRRPVRPFGVIPHFHDIPQAESWGKAVMPPTRPWRDVLTFILGCELVISSSLHGLILAEVFGVPARWWRAPELKSAVTESQFKYNDYYLSTGRSSDDWCSTIEEARARGGKGPPAPQVPSDPLLEAFPREQLGAATPLDSLAWLASRAVRSVGRRF